MMFAKILGRPDIDIFLIFRGKVGCSKHFKRVFKLRFKFDFELEDGETIIVEFEPVDYDDSGNIEFEISALKIRNLILVWIRIKLCTFLHSRGTTEQNS